MASMVPSKYNVDRHEPCLICVQYFYDIFGTLRIQCISSIGLSSPALIQFDLILPKTVLLFSIEVKFLVLVEASENEMLEKL